MIVYWWQKKKNTHTHTHTHTNCIHDTWMKTWKIHSWYKPSPLWSRGQRLTNKLLHTPIMRSYCSCVKCVWILYNKQYVKFWIYLILLIAKNETRSRFEPRPSWFWVQRLTIWSIADYFTHSWTITRSYCSCMKWEHKMPNASNTFHGGRSYHYLLQKNTHKLK